MATDEQYKEVGEKVIKVVSDYISELNQTRKGKHKSASSLEMQVIADLEFDSLDCVEVEMNLEDAFNIDMSDSGFEDKSDVSLGEVAKYIADKLYS